MIVSHLVKLQVEGGEDVVYINDHHPQGEGRVGYLINFVHAAPLTGTQQSQGLGQTRGIQVPRHLSYHKIKYKKRRDSREGKEKEHMREHGGTKVSVDHY